MTSPPEVDVVFLLTGQDEFDLERLSNLIEDNRDILGRLIIVSVTSETPASVRSYCSKAGVNCLFLTASSDVEAANRGLLLRGGDTFLLAEGLGVESGCLRELIAVARSSDRIAATVPALDEQAASGEAGTWVEQIGLTRTSPMPVPDHGAVLLLGAVLDMVGALDEPLSSLGTALADWSMRAQRLGFSTVRANRALVRAQANRTPIPRLGPIPALQTRHPYLAAQLSAHAEDAAAYVTRNALARHRGSTSVCLDIRYLHVDTINGTGVHAMELCRALLKHTNVRLSLLVEREEQKRAVEPLGAPVYVRAEEGIPSTVQLLHRPAQVFRPSELAFLLRSPVPLAITFQDLIAYRAASTRSSAEDHLEYQLLSYLAIRSAQLVLTFSEHTRREIITEFGLPPDRVRAALLGVDPTSYSHRDSATNARVLAPLGVPPRFFLFVGSDYAHKNLRLILASYARFRAEWKGEGDAPGLVLVGHWSGTLDGVYPELRRRPPPGVQYVGMVSQEALIGLYQDAIALLFLSAYEGFGLPLLEAMAAGTPVVCSRLTSIPEVVGDAAVFVDRCSDEEVSRRMVELAASPELRRRLAPRGQERAAQFTWKQTALSVADAYREAIDRPPSESLFDRRMLRDLARRAFAL